MKIVGLYKGLPVIMSMIAWQSAAFAQDQDSPSAPQVEPPLSEDVAIEEVVVTGRFISASQLFAELRGRVCAARACLSQVIDGQHLELERLQTLLVKILWQLGRFSGHIASSFIVIFTLFP